MRIANISLLFVVFLDVMGQGLVVPVVTTMMMSPAETMLDVDTSVAMRQVYFGLTMGVFFLCWFLGAAYISKLTDSIGRKKGLLVCLCGALAAYILTIVAIYTSSFPLLIVARAISGFTAGNQPIAQAALVDVSGSDREKTRNMGLIVVSLSLGLMAGPILGGVLSDAALIGDLASIQLPFYAAGVLVVTNILLIVLFFRDTSERREAFKFRPIEILLPLWLAAKRPIVLKLSVVFFCSQLSLNAYFVFIDNYLYSRFKFDTLQNSLILIVFGAAMAAAGAFLVKPISERFRRVTIIFWTLFVMAVAEILFIANPVPVLSFVLVVPFVAAFAVNYPMMVTLFSVSVDDSEQGWIMGVTVALYTSGAGIISLIGGSLMSLDIRLPLIISVGALGAAAILIFVLWRGEEMRRLNVRG